MDWLLCSWRAPLLGHRLSNSVVGLAPDLPSVRARSQLVLPAGRLVSPSLFTVDDSRLDDFRWRKRAQVFQPKASCLACVVAEHPRLHDLIRLPDPRRNNAHRVFDSDPLNWRAHKPPHKLKRILSQLRVAQPSRRPVHAADAKVCARWVEDCKLPRIVKYISNITLVVRAWRFCRQQVTRHCIVSSPNKSVSYNAAVFTADQYPHLAHHSKLSH